MFASNWYWFSSSLDSMKKLEVEDKSLSSELLS